MPVSRANRSTGRQRGFTLAEMIIVVFLLAIAMLGILAVFDASARINKSEQDVADAQGAVRYGIYQMTRAIRMAGAGGLFVTQAIVSAPDPNLAGITIGSARGYDNVTGASVTDLTGTAVPVRDGTDMIEVRGVINSPLVGFDLASGCGTCTGTAAVNVKPTTGDPNAYVWPRRRVCRRRRNHPGVARRPLAHRRHGRMGLRSGLGELGRPGDAALLADQALSGPGHLRAPSRRLVSLATAGERRPAREGRRRP